MALHHFISIALLASIVSQCGAIEYYVKPTDFTNVTCPGQPCLSINEYTDDVAYYMKSNTVFTFLPGNHIVEMPIVAKDVQNISLAAFSNKHDTKIFTTHVMCQNCARQSERRVQYCGQVCCSVIGLINVIQASIIGLTIETNYSKSPEITGITIKQSYNVHVQVNVFCTECNTAVISPRYVHYCGIIVFQCNQLFVNGVQASHLANGIVLFRTSNTLINNSLLLNIQNYGVRIRSCVNVRLLNTIISNNNFGMYVEGGRSTRIENVNFTHNENAAKYDTCTETYISHMYALNTSRRLLFFHKCKGITVKNLSANSSQNSISTYPVTIDFNVCTDIIVLNVVFTYGVTGFAFVYCTHVYLRNVTLQSSNKNDLSYRIQVTGCFNTTMTYVYSYNNSNRYGIHMIHSNDTALLHSLLTSEMFVIKINLCRRTTLVNVSVTHLQENEINSVPMEGILIYISIAMIMKNISVSLFKRTGLDFYKCSDVTLEHSTFSTIHPTTTKEYFLQPAIMTLEDTSITLQNCVFTNNLITSVKAISSNVSLYGDLVFANNQALYGGVFVLTQSSVLLFSEISAITFQNNSAVNYGGVFYIITEEFFVRGKSLFDKQTQADIGSETKSTTNCFFQVEGERSKITLPFAGNTAGKGGDVLFGGLVALGWDGSVSCLDSFKNISDFSAQNATSVISSAPSRVCLCRDSQKDCLIVADLVTHTIYPGETLVIPAVVVGQDFGTVTGSVIAQLLVPSGLSPKSVIYLKEEQYSLLFENGPCKNLNYTFYTNCVNCKAVLVLKTDNAKVLDIMTTEDNDKLNYTWNVHSHTLPYSEFSILKHKDIISSLTIHAVDNFVTTVNGKMVFPKEMYHYPLYINISFQSCPSGFSLTTVPPFKCDCNYLLRKMPGVKCKIQDQLICRVGSVWVGKYGNKLVAASKYCPLNYCKRQVVNITLMNTTSTEHGLASSDIQCDNNHSGILCGGCKPGFSLALGSDRCLQCSNYYVFLLILYGLAGIILVLFIKILDLTISEGTLNALIFYANIIKANRYLYYNQTFLNPMTLFIAWLNLDLGIETCFVSGLTAYGRTWLQFVFPLYVWGIACLIIILAKYSRRVAKVIGKNGVPLLSTLFLFSYAKLFNTVLTALSYTTLYTTEGQVLVWSADGNIAYLGPEHAPLFAVAVATLLLLLLPYTLLLIVGQWLHIFKFEIITHFLLKLRPFLEAHYAVFKPRHHYWFGLLLVARASALLLSSIIPSNNVRIVVFAIAITSILLTCLGQNVYRNSAVSNFSTALFTNLALLNLTILFVNDTNSEVSFNTFSAVSLIQFTGLVFYKLVLALKCNRRVINFLLLKCHREEAEDDWELFEMADAVREVESESDEEENLGDNTINSLPTY